MIVVGYYAFLLNVHVYVLLDVHVYVLLDVHVYILLSAPARIFRAEGHRVGHFLHGHTIMRAPCVMQCA